MTSEQMAHRIETAAIEDSYDDLPRQLAEAAANRLDGALEQFGALIFTFVLPEPHVTGRKKKTVKPVWSELEPLRLLSATCKKLKRSLLRVADPDLKTTSHPLWTWWWHRRMRRCAVRNDTRLAVMKSYAGERLKGLKAKNLPVRHCLGSRLQESTALFFPGERNITRGQRHVLQVHAAHKDINGIRSDMHDTKQDVAKMMRRFARRRDNALDDAETRCRNLLTSGAAMEKTFGDIQRDLGSNEYVTDLDIECFCPRRQWQVKEDHMAGQLLVKSTMNLRALFDSGKIAETARFRVLGMPPERAVTLAGLTRDYGVEYPLRDEEVLAKWECDAYKATACAKYGEDCAALKKSLVRAYKRQSVRLRQAELMLEHARAALDNFQATIAVLEKCKARKAKQPTRE